MARWSFKKKKLPPSATDPADLELFAGCTEAQLEQVRTLSTPIPVSAGSHVTRDGKPGMDCVVIWSGTVAIERNGERIREAGAGELIGEIALLRGGYSPRTATAVALTDCVVRVFGAREFRRLLADQPDLRARVHALADARLAEDVERGD